MAYLILNQKALMQKLIKLSLVLTAFFLLPMFPWFGKNWMETKQVSVNALLNGKKATPDLKIDEVTKKWEAVHQ